MSKLEAPGLEQLITEWEKDAEIDRTEPAREIIRIPILHNKYNKYLMLHNLAVKRTIIELAGIRKLKWLYYNGKLSQQELADLGLEPFPFTLKSDLGVYMEADDDMAKMNRKKAYHEEASNFCQNVMKELNNRTWQLKEFMAWERFVSGQY